MNKDIVDLAEPLNIIESHILSLWQKYVLGINMSYIDCDGNNPNCTFLRKNNSFYMLAHARHVSSRCYLKF